MDVQERGPGQLDLAAGLQGYGAPLAVDQRDGPSVLENQLPAKPGKRFQDTANTLPALVREGTVVLQPVREFFVLGADAPLFHGFAPGLEIGRQRAFIGNAFRCVSLCVRHCKWP